jgi:hypothetical protein
MDGLEVLTCADDGPRLQLTVKAAGKLPKPGERETRAHVPLFLIGSREVPRNGRRHSMKGPTISSTPRTHIPSAPFVVANDSADFSASTIVRPDRELRVQSRGIFGHDEVRTHTSSALKDRGLPGSSQDS